MDAENQKFRDFSLFSFIIANVFLLIYCLILLQRMRMFKDGMNKKIKKTKIVNSFINLISEI